MTTYPTWMLAPEKVDSSCLCRSPCQNIFRSQKRQLRKVLVDYHGVQFIVYMPWKSSITEVQILGFTIFVAMKLHVMSHNLWQHCTLDRSKPALRWMLQDRCDFIDRSLDIYNQQIKVKSREQVYVQIPDFSDIQHSIYHGYRMYQALWTCSFKIYQLINSDNHMSSNQLWADLTSPPW